MFRQRGGGSSRWLAGTLVAALAGVAVTSAVLAGDAVGHGRGVDDGLVRGDLIEEKKPAGVVPAYHRGHWEMGLESAYTFDTIPNPAFAVAGRKNLNPLDYRLATQIVSLRYTLTDPCGPWFLCGVLEVNVSIVGSAIVEGPESYFVGLALGFRYYFVQPGWRLVPYLEVRGGPGVTASRGYRFAQQQDLTFTYLLGAGLRYDVNRRWSISLGVIDQHLSNAYLTNPNYGFDSLGAEIGTNWAF